MKHYTIINPLNANPTKWPKTLKQFVDKLPTNCLSVFDHFVGLAIKGLSHKRTIKTTIKSICPVPFSRIFVQKIFCKLLTIKASEADFIFGKTPWFQHIVSNYIISHIMANFSIISVYSSEHLNYENCSFDEHLNNIQTTKISLWKLLIETH